MVDVGSKDVTERIAIAEATLRMQPTTLRLIRSKRIAKGEVLAVARIAGIMAAKRTPDLIPLCHPLPVAVARIDFEVVGMNRLRIESEVKVSGKTGVEMEALAAVSVAALTVYDMCKAVDRGMTITDVRLVKKAGGRSGTWVR
jgi:cyclic pyranopterin phosphate synthase